MGDRPAHDRRYGISSEKIKEELGWQPSYTFDQALNETVEWYLSHREWWTKVRGQDYLKYYEANYRDKFDRSSSKEGVRS